MNPIHTSLVNLHQVADYLKVSPKTVYRWVSQKQIPYIKLQRHLRFDLNDVIAHFKQKSSEQLKACTPSFDLLFASHLPRSPKKEVRSLKSETAALSKPQKGQ